MVNIVPCSSFSVTSTHMLRTAIGTWTISAAFDVTLDLVGSSIGHRMGCHIAWPVTRLHFPQCVRCEEIATLSRATPQTVELALWDLLGLTTPLKNADCAFLSPMTCALDMW